MSDLIMPSAARSIRIDTRRHRVTAAMRLAWCAFGVLTLGCIPTARRATMPTPQPINTADLPVVSDPRVADSLLADVRSLDATITVRMRYGTPDNFTGAPLPGYDGNRALLRREAAAALARVQRSLRSDGLGLLVWDAYRPVRATLAMMDWTERVGRQDLVRDGYIASRSRHNLGLAIDLTLVELATGRELPMGTAYDTFSAAAHTANASGEVARNRARLVRAMEDAGFANYAQEWWHFSFPHPSPVRFDVPVR